MFLLVFLVLFAIITLFSGLALQENTGGLAYNQITYDLDSSSNIGGRGFHMPFGELANLGFSSGLSGFVATLFVMSFVAYRARDK